MHANDAAGSRPATSPPLTPAKRFAIGVAIAATAVALWFDERGAWLPQLPYVLLLLAAVVMVSAWRARVVQRREQQELAAAWARWDELAAAARAAERAGRSPVRALQEHGIGSYEVRRRLLERLREAADGADHANGDGRVDRPAAAGDAGAAHDASTR